MFAAEAIWERGERRDRLDQAMEWLLIALLAFMPLAFGAVEAWSEEIVVLGAAALLIGFLLKLILTKHVSIVWTWAYVPLAFLLLVVVVQLIPLPAHLVRVIAPSTAALKTELLGDLADTEPVLSRMTISFYPGATAHDLRLLLAAVFVFFVVLNTYRGPEQITRLLGAIMIIGGGIALVALMQNLLGNGRIYWFVPTPHGTARSGPFVNHSHYAQFMNLSLGAALGFLFIQVHQRLVSRPVTPATVAEYLGSTDARPAWVAAVLAAMGAISVFMSMSRGGMISMMIAAVFTALVLNSRRARRGPNWVTVLLALGASVCVLYIGFDAVYERLATLRDLQRAEGGRWQIVKDLAVAWTRFPVLGVGMGTHEVVYPMFGRSLSPALATHAENEYAQFAEETGVLGLLALLAIGVIVWRSYARTVHASRATIHFAAYGLGFGLIAIMIHSLSDFGQHLPSNALLSAVFCALMLRLPHLGRAQEAGVGEMVLRGRTARPWGILGLTVVCVLAAGVLLRADNARRGEAHWRNVLGAERNLTEKNWEGSDNEYTYLLREAVHAQDCEPTNIKYRHWLNVYRWHAISRVIDPNTGQVVLPTEGMEFVIRITAELKRALCLCPTFGPTWCVLGQLERSVLEHREEGARHIRKGVRLAPCDPTTCFVAGTLEAEEGQTDLAVDYLSKAVQLDEQLFREVALLFIGPWGQPHLAVQIAGDSIRRLSTVADILATFPADENVVNEVRRKVMMQLEQRCGQPNAPAWALVPLARMYARDGKVTEAITCYRRALAQRYDQVDWRCDLARLLAQTGNPDGAIEEAKICQRLRPEHPASRRLVQGLSNGPRPSRGTPPGTQTNDR